MDTDEAAQVTREIRSRDAERFELEMAGAGWVAGARLLYGNAPSTPKPTPFTPPKRESRPLNPDAITGAEEGPPPAA